MFKGRILQGRGLRAEHGSPSGDRQEVGPSTIVRFIGVKDDLAVLFSGPVEFARFVARCALPGDAGCFSQALLYLGFREGLAVELNPLDSADGSVRVKGDVDVFSQSSPEWTNVKIMRVVARRHELRAKVVAALLQCPAYLGFGAHRKEADGEGYDQSHGEFRRFSISCLSF